MMTRILFYVHYNRYDRLSEHVVYQLTKMRKLFDEIVFISNSNLSSDDKEQISSICDELLVRKNSGYDFAAWRDGITMFGWSKLSKFDSVTLMNDTCFGPIYSMNDVYLKMESASIDFWGITNHTASLDGMPGSNSSIPAHIQSYMTVYNRKVFESSAFQDFWEKVNDYQDVNRVICEYETQLTGLLQRANFTHKVLFDTEGYSKAHKIFLNNYSELLPLVMIRNKVPLLKIKSFKHTPVWLIKRELSGTGYPLGLIEKHLKTMNIKSASLVKYYSKAARRFLIKSLKMIYNKINGK